MDRTERYPSYAACVADALSSSTQPLSVENLLNTVASQRPLGKGARSAVYRAINKLFQAVPVAPGRFGWLSHLLAGSVFRHPLTGEETRRGFILLDELEHIVFFPQFFQSYRPDGRVLTIDLFGGPTIQAEAAIERKTWSLHLGQEFVDWIDELGGQNRDDLLISVVDANRGHFAIRLQLREMRDESELQNRNIQLALLAEEIIAEDRRATPLMPTWELAARLIARGFYQKQPSADDLHYVLHEYSMLRFADGIGYQLVADVDDDDIASPPDRVFAGFLDDNSDQDTLASSGTSRGQRTTQWDSIFDADPQSDDGEPSGSCPGYEEYLTLIQEADPLQIPLNHEEFHMLEAELEMLVSLEQEFGHLLAEQAQRKNELAERLFIDPDSLLNSGDDWDLPDEPDSGPPTFWAN
jgi:hypothetical protein